MDLKEAVNIYARPYSSSRDITLGQWFKARGIVFENPKEAKAIGRLLTKTKELE